ncbi:hypothetical protein [Krasilnikovia sp. M28-CT-15]|uniref:hypothetical protein n=1 Tax=Krasilnikovia sp. M28-CT-15 TaxID=3373540 RepID=UPI00399C9782
MKQRHFGRPAGLFRALPFELRGGALRSQLSRRRFALSRRGDPAFLGHLPQLAAAEPDPCFGDLRRP